MNLTAHETKLYFHDSLASVHPVYSALYHGLRSRDPHLQPALDALHDTIPVAPISETVANREDVVRSRLDPGEAQAFSLADTHDGRLLTDDSDARTFAKQQGVTVVGSVGVLLTALDAGHISEVTANDWLQTWIDDYGYYVPYRTIDDYR